MLKIKWNLIPPEFKVAYYEPSCDSKIMVCQKRYQRTSNPLETFKPEGYLRELMISEFEVYNLDDLYEGQWWSRKDWELEQWKQAPEWAMYHVAFPNGQGMWLEEDPKEKFHRGDRHLSGVTSCMPQFIFQYGEDWKQSLRKRPEAVTKIKEMKEVEKSELCSCPSCELVKEKWKEELLADTSDRVSEFASGKITITHEDRLQTLEAEFTRRRAVEENIKRKAKLWNELVDWIKQMESEK